MIVYDGFHLIGLAALATLIIVYVSICIICRIADKRKNREERINEKLQEKYDKEENKNADS